MKLFALVTIDTAAPVTFKLTTPPLQQDGVVDMILVRCSKPVRLESFPDDYE